MSLKYTPPTFTDVLFTKTSLRCLSIKKYCGQVQSGGRARAALSLPESIRRICQESIRSVCQESIRSICQESIRSICQLRAYETYNRYNPVDGHGQPSPQKPLIVGFGHDTVLGAAGTVIKGIESGAIKRFFLIGGCDGAAESRNYFTDLAENVPETSVILTLGTP